MKPNVFNIGILIPDFPISIFFPEFLIFQDFPDFSGFFPIFRNLWILLETQHMRTSLAQICVHNEAERIPSFEKFSKKLQIFSRFSLNFPDFSGFSKIPIFSGFSRFPDFRFWIPDIENVCPGPSGGAQPVRAGPKTSQVIVLEVDVSYGIIYGLLEGFGQWCWTAYRF